MKVVIAPDSFKESLSSLDVARHIEAGFREIFPDWTYVKVPVADGGEGTVEALVAATEGRIVRKSVIGPLGEAVDGFFGLTGDGRTAVIEMAAASGLMLLHPGQSDPMRATTFGVGQLILAGLDIGARHLIIGIGGSATNDGGAGMAQALGARLLDQHGVDIELGGGALSELARIDVSELDPRLAECRIEVACDVDNVLTGPLGASAIFGPQKGADAQMVRQLDDNLVHYARRIEEGLGVSVDKLAGGGAAGGLGAALVVFLGARLLPGIEIVADAVNLEALVAGADLVITGEGRIDGQSVYGKTPVGIARVAKRHAKPVIGIAGSLGLGSELVLDQGIDAIFGAVQQTCTVEEAFSRAAHNVRRASRNVAAAIEIGSMLPPNR